MLRIGGTALALFGAALALVAGCRGIEHAPEIPGARVSVTEHYVVRTDAPPAEAALVAGELEKLYACYLRLLPPPDRCRLERDLADRPLEVLLFADEAAFRRAAAAHEAGQVDGFFCEGGGECVLGPGIQRRLQAGLTRREDGLAAPPEARDARAAWCEGSLGGCPARPATGVEASAVLARPAEAHLDPAFRRAAASDVQVLYHEGFHQYLARLGARGLEPWLAEGLAERYARLAAREKNASYGPERLEAERADLWHASAEVERQPSILGSDDLANVSLRDLGKSLSAYRVYWLFVVFLEEGEGGRLAPRLASALRRACSGHRARVDLTGLFSDAASLEAAFRRFARSLSWADA